MSYQYRPSLSVFIPNCITGLLVLLTVGVQVAAIWAVADPLQAVESPAPVETAENQPTTAIPIVMVILAELAIVWVLWLLYQHVPDWVQRLAKGGLIVLGIGYAVLYAASIMPILFWCYAAILLTYGLGYQWLSYDIGGLIMGVIIAATLGGYFGPVPVALLVAGLIIYDWVAVVETDVMSNVVELLSGIGLPVMVILPKQPSFDLSTFLDDIADDLETADWQIRVYTVIGVGDFAIPAALTTAVFRFHGAQVSMFVLVGTIIGMLLLGKHIGGEKTLPGLPWLGGGAIGGYGIGVFVLLELPKYL